jgi:hypothetical protein
VNSQVVANPIATSVAICSKPERGWPSLEKGQLPNVNPVKMNARMVQNSTALTAGKDAPMGLHFGSASSHQERTESRTTATVTTTGVRVPNRGTVAAGSALSVNRASLSVNMVLSTPFTRSSDPLSERAWRLALVACFFTDD